MRLNLLLKLLLIPLMAIGAFGQGQFGGGGGGGTGAAGNPAGPANSVQVNAAGAFGGNANLTATFTGGSNGSGVLTIAGDIVFGGQMYSTTAGGTLWAGTKQAGTSVTVPTSPFAADFAVFIGSDNIMRCQLSIVLGSGLCMNFTGIGGVATTAQIPDLSATYMTQTQLGAANGAAQLNASSQLPINALGTATGADTVALGNFPQVRTTAQTTASQTAIGFNEATAAIGAGDIQVGISTLAGSTSIPLSIVQGSLTGTTGPSALSITSTYNNASLSQYLINAALTLTASSGNAGFLNFLGGAAGTTQIFTIDKLGNVTLGGTISGVGTNSTTQICGSNNTSCFTSFAGQIGGVQLQGANNSSTNAAAKAGPALLMGGALTAATPSASALPGVVEVGEFYLKGTAVAAVGDVVCATATAYTVTDCSNTGPQITIVGIATSIANPIGVIRYGTAAVALDAAGTVGDIVCMGTTTAGKAHDNGTAACATAGTTIGVIVSVAGTLTQATGTSTGTVTLSTTLAEVALRL